MIDLCIFDFDNTLMMTDDLSVIRDQGIEKLNDRNYRAELKALIGDIKSRLLYTENDLQNLRAENPSMKFALFSLAPVAYLEVIDNLAYPEFQWDSVVSYENITDNRFKPNGFGIELLMHEFGLTDPSKVVMVGDSVKDVASAYNAGCYAVLDKSSWPKFIAKKHWSALKLVPDLVIESQGQLSDFIKDQGKFLPALECLINKGNSEVRVNDIHNLRYDGFNYFPPYENRDFKKNIIIYSAGRLYPNYESLENRRKWHAVTDIIYKQKNSEEFGKSWISAILGFIDFHYKKLHLRTRPLVISSIPDRPGRISRQKALIEQLEKHFDAFENNEERKQKVRFSYNVLNFKPSARSNSGDRLSFFDRFTNVNDNLFVVDNKEVVGTDYLIIDDVVTTGASLMYAKQKLQKAGARNVVLFALAKTMEDFK